jgi:two-component system OmpR family response regulator
VRVLLIEDDHVLGAAIRDHVLSTGHAVDWMQRIDDARLALAGVPYELVLLDLNLPDGRGLDLLKDLRSAGNAVPVIITTA